MHRRSPLSRVLTAVICVPLTALAVGCGDDANSTSASDASTAASASPAATTSAATTAASSGAASGVQAFCEAWAELDMLDTPGGPTDSSPEDLKAFAAQVAPFVETSKANAPASLAGPMDVMTDVVAKLGEGDGSVFETPEFTAANEAIEASLRTDCGFPAIDVSAKEYAFTMPASVPAGPVSVRLTNTGNEPHVLLFVKKPTDGSGDDPLEFVGRYLEGVFSGDPAQMEKYASVNVSGGGPFAAPGAVGTKVTDFTPGDYYYFCPIPVGGVDGAPPHFTQGMLGQFTVK
ncbi:MAG: hypothetical protein AB7N61_14575 [Acidimicrobiia bacterium]